MSEHLSSEQMTDLLMDEDSQDQQRHLSECAICRQEFDDLRNAFMSYREAGRNWSEHWMTQKPVAQTLGGRRAGLWAAATVLVAFVLVWTSAPPPRVEEPFVSIPYVVPAASYERTQVIRMDVPAAALRSAGLRMQLTDAGASVRADVLVGQDGRALAVRLLEGRFN
jgi:hypothetical protein